MASEKMHGQHESAGAWAKRYYQTSQAALESVLRPYGLGPTQWYVLYHLAHDGPTKQRDLVRALRIERATMTGVASALVRKGFVEQTPDPGDMRQKTLRLTEPGRELWTRLPDPVARILAVAFDGVSEEEQARVAAVLRGATERLAHHLKEETTPS
ncbi:MarR family winged helix-turn-helix transcriptional regulator [Streptomyces sp. Tu6071]|uniref:MarR family winged helix-turn-helix transcriptional regulator n=1 Tax=Streptomyces sp. Tu6071 TaxID=355249 RepID=UPI001F3F02E9|nr:MarR family transcriptional regulator [Streptomyces sp. Tu6071]